MSTKMDLRMLDGTVVVGVSIVGQKMAFQLSNGATLNLELATVVGSGITKEIIKTALGYEPLGALSAQQVFTIMGFTPVDAANVVPGNVFEIGRYVDFHAVNRLNDYDVRLECTVPVGGSMTSNLNIWAAMVYTNGSMRVDGNISGLSDVRRKKCVEAIQDSLKITAQLEGITYIMKDDPTETVRSGLRAQDVLKVFAPAADASDPDNLAVMYGNLAGLFVQNINELALQNEKLTKANLALERRMSSIERQMARTKGA